MPLKSGLGIIIKVIENGITRQMIYDLLYQSVIVSIARSWTIIDIFLLKNIVT